MDQKESLIKLRAYNRTRSPLLCTGLEKLYMKHIDENNYMYTYGVHNADLPEDVETFLAQQKQFRGLLGEHHEKLCRYLRHIQEYTCNADIVRMDVRSRKFYRSKSKVLRAIGAFYWFYGAEMSMKDLIYGEYRDLIYNSDFSPVIASELLADDLEAIQYCKDVLTSENNTAVLTRDVIVAVEQSHNEELQKLLLQVFLAAKLQEGLRQSVVETADENTFSFFEMVMDAIEEENLLRFSSVQRAVLTWIGIGYQEVKEKDVRYIFEHIRGYMGKALTIAGGNIFSAMEISDNPLDIYIALYCIGVHDVEAAIGEACRLLRDSRRYVVASALVYLRMTRCFEAVGHLDLPERFPDDDWVLALFYAECVRLWEDIQKLPMTEKEGRKLYGQMEAFLPVIKNKKTYCSKGFEWFVLGISKAELCHSMFFLLDRFPSADLAERYLPYVSSVLSKKEMDRYMEKYFPLISESSRKHFMVKEIISSNQDLRKWIVKKYTEKVSNQQIKLTEEDLLQLEDRLKTKKAGARADIVEVLAAQSEEMVRASYARLIESPVKTVRESALELRQKGAKYFSEEKVSGLDPLPGTAFGAVEIKGREKGFGLYQPKHVYNLDCPDYLHEVKKGLLKKTTYVDLKDLFPWDRQQVLGYIRKWSARITQHEKDEYYTGHEYRQVGERAFYPLNYQVQGLGALPLAETWKAYFAEDRLAKEVVFEIQFLLSAMRDNIKMEKMLNVQSEFFTLEHDEVKNITYITHFNTIFGKYFQEVTQTEGFSQAARRLLQLITRYPKTLTYRQERYQAVDTCALTNNHSVYFLESQLKLQHPDDEEFRKNFPVIWEMYKQFNLGTLSDVQGKPVIGPTILARALHLGILPAEALYEGILDLHMEAANRYSYSRTGGQLSDAFRDAYYEGKGVWGRPRLVLEQYHHAYGDMEMEVILCLRNALDHITDTLLAMECQRLNEKTEVTDYVRSLLVIRGVKYLLMALRMLEGENISRQTYGDERDVVFSNVIRHCYPNNGEKMEKIQDAGESVPGPSCVGKSDAEILAAAGIRPERLVEVAMLAPQWIDTVNEVLKWDGFREACYYFTAHMKQYDFQQKKAEIAKYTELEPEDLNDGAFDMEWCRSVYEALGEKRFQMLYKASRFLCENSFHTRARKYADACLGRKGKEEWKREAAEKRNKDALNAYCICPLADDADLLERYLYVQQFLKESKKYGAQRQASEKRAVEMALMNLARNSRFETVTRLSWMMESEGIRQNAEVLEPKIVSGQQKDCIEAWIEIDTQGRNEICIRKNGKKQKSIPAALKKNEWILHLKEIHSQWNDQYKRSRRMLEQAMEERTEFTREELDVMMANPIVAPMLEKLVMICGDAVGFYKDGKLEMPGGIRIAHPYDLYRLQCWKAYQQQLFETGVVQPFKQVFRELYLKLDEESDQSMSRRYSGYQIQTKKAAAALKSRKWNVSYESGLERIYYKENLVVNLFAEADWFSPSDIEAPGIEYVAFYSRKEGTPVLIRDIDPVVFSETMRDIDLAVSTAYVGGVDPITSFSTIELRRAIVEYTCRLMKLENVTVQEHFANIKGCLNEYSVHLGSGGIHQSGGAAIHIIAVHSGKRGKVYLPFLDEDPKTAEIISKVVMLAEDGKIKDPEVLRQIRR